MHRALYLPYLPQVSRFLRVSCVVMVLGVCVQLFYLVPILYVVPSACLLVHSTSCAGLCLCVRASVRAVAGWALRKHKKYFSRCRSPDVESVAERKPLMSNNYFAEYPQIVSRHLAFPWTDANCMCVSG